MKRTERKLPFSQRHYRVLSPHEPLPDIEIMPNPNARFVRNIVRDTLGPRYTWRLGTRTREFAEDLPARLRNARRRLSTEPSHDEEQPVFVFSAGWRSGSTLLQRMIMANNKTILIWGEPFAHSNIHDGLTDHFRAFTHDWPPDTFFLSAAKLQDPSNTWVANLYPEVADLVSAHRSFYTNLFSEPAHRAGWTNWGLKEVRLTIDHAAYFRFLYPKCKIILLYRNPHDAYLSLSRWNLTVWRTWPDRFIASPYAFGRMWAQMVRGYLDGYKQIDAALIRYEDLDDPVAVERLQNYLGWQVPRGSEMRQIRDPEHVRTDRHLKRKSLRAIERALLNLATRAVIEDAGYREMRTGQ